MTKISILIADDQPLIRDGLAAILTMEEKYTVVARTGDGLATIQQAQLHRPNLVLMDIHMPKLDGLEAAKRITSEFPDTKILILTTFEDEKYILEAIRNGASGFLLKGTDTEKILSAIEDCLAGRINYPYSIQLRLQEALASSDDPANERPLNEALASPAAQRRPIEKLDSLTLQEKNIVSKLKQGCSNQAIAAELFLTTGTVKNYLYTIYKKLNVSSRSEAIAYLHQHNL